MVTYPEDAVRGRDHNGGSNECAAALVAGRAHPVVKTNVYHVLQGDVRTFKWERERERTLMKPFPTNASVVAARPQGRCRDLTG